MKGLENVKGIGIMGSSTITTTSTDTVTNAVSFAMDMFSVW